MDDQNFDVRCAQLFISSTLQRGLSEEVVRNALGLHRHSDLLDPRALAGLGLAQVSRATKALLHDEFGGITSARCRSGTFQVMAEFAVSATTLGDALDRAFRFYGVIVDEVAFRLLAGEESAAIEVEMAKPPPDAARSICHEWWLLYWWNFANWLVGEWTTADLAETPTNLESDPSGYLCRLSRDWRRGRSPARLTFPARLLRKRITRSRWDICRFQKDATSHWGSNDAPSPTLKATVRAKLRSALDSTQSLPTLDDLAAEYGFSAQTLRRRLESAGTSYAQLKEDVRKDFVLNLLKDELLPLSEISFQAGFAEPGGLSRAVRHWTGLSPTEYRTRN